MRGRPFPRRNLTVGPDFQRVFRIAMPLGSEDLRALNWNTK
jgi:hypothetical protein